MIFGKNNLVWYNGKVVRADELSVGIGTHGLHYGTGVFEGIRSYATDHGVAIFRLPEHLQRLCDSAHVYGMNINFSEDELIEACRQVVALNELTNCYLRPLVFLGDDSLGIKANPEVNVAVMAFEWSTNPKGQSEGIRATISSYTKFNSSMIPTTAKASGQYINSRLALREATARGFDEAILLNTEGNIAEGSVENIFIVKDGTLYTNDAESSILMGITRASVIDLARDLGIPVIIKSLTVAGLKNADEVFFTGTAVEVIPVREVDETMIGNGEIGVLTKQLQSLFNQTTKGQNSLRQSWLTLVENNRKTDQVAA